MTRFNGAAGEVMANLSTGIVPLGQGAMFTGLIWGAVLVFIIDNQFEKAAITTVIGALISATGFMHAPSLTFLYNYQYTVGYGIITLLFAAFHLGNKKLKKLGA
jgi:AGZA family xanthine/uracil permease-like MFS transporter